jgi:hypothetical protein
MKLSLFGELLETMYSDTMTVYRYTTSTNSDGTTSTKLSQNAIYTDIPCRISAVRSDNSESSLVDKNPQRAEIKIFCGTQYDIHKGDKIVATKKQDNGETLITYTGTSNLPLIYVTHAEIVLVDVGDA